MLADSHLSDDELDVLRELTEDWRGTAFSFEQYLGPAVAKARTGVRATTRSPSCSTTSTHASRSRVLRKALFSAARQLAGADDTVSSDENASSPTSPSASADPHSRIWAKITVNRQFGRRCVSTSATDLPQMEGQGRRATATRSRPARSGRISTSS